MYCISFLSVPPSPQNVLVQTRLSQSLLIRWEPPYPSHGILVRYEVKYHPMLGLPQPLMAVIGPDVLEYNISGLEPNSTYGLQVCSLWNKYLPSYCQSLAGEPLMPVEKQKFFATALIN